MTATNQKPDIQVECKRRLGPQEWGDLRLLSDSSARLSFLNGRRRRAEERVEPCIDDRATFARRCLETGAIKNCKLKLRLDPRRFGLTDANDALRLVEKGGPNGKIVVDIKSD